MKKSIRPILTSLILAGLVFMNACKGGGDGPTAADINTEKLLAHPWHLSNATVDAVDKTSVYSGLSITFTAANYTATNVTPSWPVTGTWKFASDDGKTILRGDGLQIELIEIDDQKMKISYTWTSTTLKPGRVQSVAGKHTLTFAKAI